MLERVTNMENGGNEDFQIVIMKDRTVYIIIDFLEA